MEQKKHGTAEYVYKRQWEKKEDKCEFYEKQDAYCTKNIKKNCENVENDEKIWKIR